MMLLMMTMTWDGKFYFFFSLYHNLYIKVWNKFMKIQQIEFAKIVYLFVSCYSFISHTNQIKVSTPRSQNTTTKIINKPLNNDVILSTTEWIILDVAC